MEAVYNSDKIKEWMNIYHQMLSLEMGTLEKYIKSSPAGKDMLMVLLTSAREIPPELRDGNLEVRIECLERIFSLP